MARSAEQAVCDKFKRENGLTYKPNQVTVGTGGKQVAVQCAARNRQPRRRGYHSGALLGSYPDIVNLAEGIPVFIQMRE